MPYQLMKKKDLAASRRQIAMVLDLNKCLDCQTCTIACKTQWTFPEGKEYMYWNNVETHPGRGYPGDWQQAGGGFKEDERSMNLGKVPDPDRDYGRAWTFNHEAVYTGGQFGKERFKPDGDPKWGPNWDEDQGGGEYPNGFYFYLQRICNHCTHPACLEACPRNAIYKREEDGIVLVDQERCNGYRFCLEACPYKKIYYNVLTQKAEKCIFCYPRIEKGQANACARQCPGRLRFVGYRDDEAGPIFKLVDKYKVALPLHPETRTKPNVFYILPISPPQYDRQGRLLDPLQHPRIPTDYLRSLFGPETDAALAALHQAMEQRRRGERNELMEILIARRWEDSFKLK